MSTLKNFIFILLSFTFLTCEKDDICDPSLLKTPHLIIEFYDRTQTNLLKNVQDFKVFDEDNQKFLVINPAGTGEERFILTANQLKLPLNTLANSSKYQFVFNANENPEINPNKNIDILTFNYTLDYEYVSRGCGYKALFNNLLPINLVDSTISDNLWISSIQVINTNIINEDITHVKIFF